MSTPVKIIRRTLFKIYSNMWRDALDIPLSLPILPLPFLLIILLILLILLSNINILILRLDVYKPGEQSNTIAFNKKQTVDAVKVKMVMR